MASSTRQSKPSDTHQIPSNQIPSNKSFDLDANFELLPADEADALDHIDEEAIHIDVFNDNECIIWAVNAKMASLRMVSLLAHINALPRPPDVIAIQDPPPKMAFTIYPPYKTWLHAEDSDDGKVQEMTKEDNPAYFPYRPPQPKKAEKEAIAKWAEDKRSGLSRLKKLAKVAFLIHGSIQQWHVTEPDPNEPNRGIVATLHLETSEGSLAIHNVYNNLQNLAIDPLMALCCDEFEAHVCVGDFNLHHPLWGGDSVTADSKAEQLVTAMASLQVPLLCMNTKGVNTYASGLRQDFQAGDGQAGGQAVSGETAIDLVLIGEVLEGQVRYQLFPPRAIRGFESDHAISELAVNMNMVRRTGIRHDWNGTDKEAYIKRVKEGLKDIELPEHRDEANVGAVLSKLLQRAIIPAVNEAVPTIMVYEPKEKEPSPIPTTPTQKTRSWRRAVKRMIKRAKTVHHVAKKACKWGLPRQMDFTPDFDVGTGPIKSNPDKVKCYVTSTWTHTRHKGPPRATQSGVATPGNSSIPSASHEPPQSSEKPDFPLPSMIRDEPPHESPQHIKQEEVKKLLRHAPLRKASGHDGVAYEALKMCMDEITPLLTWIFQACNDLGCHLQHFKDCITIVIKKPGKPSDKPTSYRPIAILNTIGKLYERLLADRCKELIVEQKLIKGLQFGLPGRNTTLAVEYLTNTIHSAWHNDRSASLLGLDLSGAYDHVDRTKLLESMIDKRFPHWLVKVIWSFLSDRRSYIHMPGYEGDEYWIDVGVPQGSPLSSLLFLIYAAPLLDEVNQGHGVVVFSYVDDTYIVATSNSYENNVKLLADTHNKLHEWAERHNLRFSPTKYNVMHFLRPHKQEPRVADQLRLLPDIPGFRGLTQKEKDKILAPTVKVLGVVFDRRLTFEAHVESIVAKVRTDLAAFKRFNGPTHGLDVIGKRQLYWGQMLPKIQYAAAGWYIHDPSEEIGKDSLKYPISATALKRLETLQTEILTTLSGAWKYTVSEIIEKEIHVIPILAQLHGTAMNHRCKWAKSEEYNIMRAARVRGRKARSGDFPFNELDKLTQKYLDMTYAAKWNECQAKVPRKLKISDEIELLGQMHESLVVPEEDFTTINVSELDDEYVPGGEQESGGEERGERTSTGVVDINNVEDLWFDPLKRQAWVKEFTANLVFRLAERWWQRWKNEQADKNKVFHAAHEGNWGDHFLKLYVGLDAAQGTKLLGMRTGNLGVRTNPTYQFATKSFETICPLCNKKDHTIEHLMMKCSQLAIQRTFLFEAAGHQDFSSFLSNPKYTEMAASWSISFMRLEQFNHCKNKKKYAFPRQLVQPRKK